ncbi:MAG: hypothetical protein AB8H80_02805 [Planctomycetota bacterium]
MKAADKSSASQTPSPGGSEPGTSTPKSAVEAIRAASAAELGAKKADGTSPARKTAAGNKPAAVKPAAATPAAATPAAATPAAAKTTAARATAKARAQTAAKAQLPPARSPLPPAATKATDPELDELCRILVGADRERLQQALARLEDRGAFTDLQSQTLANAMQMALARDPAFADSMGTMISRGVHSTVNRDSAAFGRALAPAMGPAIRNAVWMMLQGFVQSIETTVDQQLSIKSLRWRFQALRTGRKFAEIAFVNTVLFRVEHVFLVHKENGLELLHATRPGVIAREPDLITAMLTAIQDFLRDAFEADDSQATTSFAVGDLSVVIENGSQAALAAVVRGRPRAEIRMQLRESLDRIETTMANQLKDFDGDTEIFETVRPQLEACLLESQIQAETEQKKRRPPVVRWVALAATLGLLTWWAIAAIAANARRSQLEAFVAKLHAEPGIVITDSSIEDGHLSVRGLRDPLARELALIAATNGVGDLVTADFQPHQSLHESFVAKRIERTLQPPRGVTFELVDGRLAVGGQADHSWIERTRTLAPAFTGVQAIDLRDCVDLDRRAFDETAAQLHALEPELRHLRADQDDKRLTSDHGATHEQLVRILRTLQAQAQRLDKRLEVSADLIWWSADVSSAAAKDARKLAREVGREVAMALPIKDYVSDRTIPHARLRLSARLVE